MICPSCNQSASTWVRNSFSLQGVTLGQSFKGELKCQHCGALLRNVKYSKHFWFALSAMALFLFLVAVFSDRLYLSFGFIGAALYCVALVILSTLVFMYTIWKFAVLEIVPEREATKKQEQP